MSKIIEIMKKKNALIGMVHLLPLPGTRNFGGSIEAIFDAALKDARALEEAGFDAYMVEPNNDSPSGLKSSTFRIAMISAVIGHVSRQVSLPFGISFGGEDSTEVLSIAKATGADFVRVYNMVDDVVFSTGRRLKPCAAAMWEAKYALHAEDIAILADIHVKHARMTYPDVTIEQSAVLAQMQGASAIIVTGTTTGEETPMTDLKKAASVVRIPLVSGSGVNVSNVKEQLTVANGLIIGSSIKVDGKVSNPIDPEICREMVKNAKN